MWRLMSWKLRPTRSGRHGRLRPKMTASRLVAWSASGKRAQLPSQIRELVLDDQRLRNELCWLAFDC